MMPKQNLLTKFDEHKADIVAGVGKGSVVGDAGNREPG